jgi:hypothetical protein
MLSTRDHHHAAVDAQESVQRTCKTICRPSGDQCASWCSPCSASDAVVRCKYANVAAGCTEPASVQPDARRQAGDTRTRTRHSASPVLVTTQKSVLRKLGTMQTTGSGERPGRAATVESCLAAEVGKYIVKANSRVHLSRSTCRADGTRSPNAPTRTLLSAQYGSQRRRRCRRERDRSPDDAGPAPYYCTVPIRMHATYSGPEGENPTLAMAVAAT